MKVIIQRVNYASVSVDGVVVGNISRGLLLLVGFSTEDSEKTLNPMAKKLSSLRVFPAKEGNFHLSVLDINGEILAVPQFTLYADVKKGRRPDFVNAMKPEKAKVLFEQFVRELNQQGIKRIDTGRFQAEMQVLLENDGPVTIVVEM